MRDDLGRQVVLGDWIGFKGSYTSRIETGFIVSFTGSGNPRVLVYEKDYRQEPIDGIHQRIFSGKPKAITNGYIKLEKPTDLEPGGHR